MHREKHKDQFQNIQSVFRIRAKTFSQLASRLQAASDRSQNLIKNELEMKCLNVKLFLREPLMRIFGGIMNRFVLISISILCLSSMVDPCWATRAYVTDSFRISIRRGPSLENKILKFLPSGQDVEILDTQEGWSYIRTLESNENITKGWVLRRYLITREPWEIQTQSFKNENLKLKKKLENIHKEWTEKFTKDVGDFKTLKKNHDVLLKTLQTQKRKIATLKEDQSIKWFAMGALVLLFGLMIGLVIGKKQKKSRTSYY